MTNKPKTKPKLLQIACLNIYIYSSLLLMLQILLQNTAPGNTGRPHSSVCCNILRDSIPYLSKAVLPSQKFGKTHIREVFELFRNSCEVLPSFWQFCILAVRVLGSELALPFLVCKKDSPPLRRGRLCAACSIPSNDITTSHIVVCMVHNISQNEVK